MDYAAARDDRQTGQVNWLRVRVRELERLEQDRRAEIANLREAYRALGADLKTAQDRADTLERAARRVLEHLDEWDKQTAIEDVKRMLGAALND